MGLGAPAIVAWIDASAGIAGDMLLGALVDAGAELGVLQASIDAVIPGTVRLVAASTTRGGLRAIKVDVELIASDQPHRRWTEIRGRLRVAELPERTRQRALSAFEVLARVEASVHGIDVEQVHFHEVGAWDSIADIVGVCAALDVLEVGEVVVSRIAVGSGSVQTAHGRIPVPVPAVLGLAAGWEVEAVGDGELATPTGVALVTTLAQRQGPIPEMRVVGSGVGAGTRDVAGRANVVRVVIGVLATGRPASAADESAFAAGDPAGPGIEASAMAVGGLTTARPAGGADESAFAAGDPAGPGIEASAMVVLEANVDDLDPRVWPSVLEACLAASAADAWLVPILMKHGRPAHTLCVLASAAAATRLRDVLLDETSTIGVREAPVRRWALPRGWVEVDVAGQLVGVKVAHRDGLIVHATPEYRDVVAASSALGRPVRDVLDAAIAAAVAAGLTRGAPVPGGIRPQA
ncbi:MAG: nickel pincer cofactor biosynthesis protein LarC [Micrococcales bacterium]|nr:nickel pincer cofactor biosynthesis protein LarC [Micrococcales bacterium]